MSQSRIDWEKANRDQNVKQSRQVQDLERPLEGGMPAQLREKLQERKLKPFFIERVQSVKPETKGVLKAVEYISESRITLLARDEPKDGEVRCQCQMEFNSFVDLERGEEFFALYLMPRLIMSSTKPCSYFGLTVRNHC
jgi:hypothetical protein